MTKARPLAALYAAVFLAAPAHGLTPQEDLAAAIARAPAGGEVVLAAGDYGALVLKGVRPAAQVVIRSQDPAVPAVLTGLRLENVANLTFAGLVFDYRAQAEDAPAAKPFELRRSQAITLRDNHFDGDLLPDTSAPDRARKPTGFGLSIRDCREITVQGNHFARFLRGVVLRDSDRIALAGNEITAMRSDGINGAALQQVSITGNSIHDFDRSEGSTDHPDMIQFWTNGTTRPSRDILIAGNVLAAGEGPYTQSIFLRNELVDQGIAGEEMFYRNITIRENVILNAHLHGVTVGEVIGLEIRRNSVLRAGAGRATTVSTPQIRVSAQARAVVIAGNVTAKITAPSGAVVEGNLLVQEDNPRLPNHYDALFAPKAGRRIWPADFAPRGALAGQAVGAPLLGGAP